MRGAGSGGLKFVSAASGCISDCLIGLGRLLLLIVLLPSSILGSSRVGKRSPDFERKPRDLYQTPPEGCAPLLPHIVRGATFVEPCAAGGAMVDYFESAGHRCVFACDIEPLRADVTRLSALDLRWIAADLFITNPPWEWSLLEPIVMHLSGLKPSWLLLPADLMHNVRAARIMSRCSMVVPIGRLKWEPGSKHTGKDNCCWYLFAPGHNSGPKFTPRARRNVAQ